MNTTVFFLALRKLRAPIILLVLVFAVGMLGLVLIPGVDAQGEAWHLNFAQALYVMAYTATTIGFGEIPHAYTDAQRLWVTVMIFASVLGWAYLLTSVMRLAGDRAFRHALEMTRFRREVARIRGAFLIVCGIGETGSLVCRSFDLLGYRFVAIDIRQTPVDELELSGLMQDPPSLVADARLPEHLIAAGLKRGTCKGVLALTNNDRANLAIAMTVRLIKPDTPVLARAQSRDTAANLASFNTDYVINPFATFGIVLALAISAPSSYRLLIWLTSLPGGRIGPELAPPRGHWVVCGYGRFGSEVVRALRQEGMQVTVINPQSDADKEIEIDDDVKVVSGAATQAEPLREAGIETAVGIVAGSADDVDNLSMVVTARELNKELFTIVRQNLRANEPLFRAFDADMTMVPSELVANECLAFAHTALVGRFIRVILDRDEAWAGETIRRLLKRNGSAVPELWSVQLNASGAPALHRMLMFDHERLLLSDLQRDPHDRDNALALMPLCLLRERELQVLPADDELLRAGDEILYAGRPEARDDQQVLLRNVNVRDYLLTGVDRPGGWIWRTFGAPAKRPAAPAGKPPPQA